MSWFDEVTGTNDYERQSWRDNFNGGRAAGDLTGATNARLQAERDAFQGTTWSGSSSQPSALELARSMLGPGNQSVRVGQGSTGGGAGNEVVTQGPVKPGKPAGGKGAGSRLTITGPLKPGFKDTATGGYAGVKFEPNPWFSDVEEWWEPRYGEPGEWLGGIVNIVSDGAFNSARFVDHATGSRIVTGERGSPAPPSGGFPAVRDAFERQFNLWDRQLHETFSPSRPYVGGGF